MAEAMPAASAPMAKKKAYPLSDDDIQALLPGTPTVLYSELEGKAFKDITDNNGHAMVLFVNEETPTEVVGHWLAIVKLADGVLLFDPYGSVRPDPWYRNAADLTKAELAETHQSRPVLEQIVRDAGYRPLFNRTAFQQDKRDVNTCGRHCVVRIWHAHLDNEDYAAALYGAGENADTVVTKLTDDVLYGRSKQRHLVDLET